MILQIGDRGRWVGELHQRLLEVGETVDVGDLQDRFYGPSTRAAVLDFQSSHYDARGRLLVQDGEVGDRTWASLGDPHGPHERFVADGWMGDPASASDRARPAVIAAINEVGTLEEPPGSNRGPRVDEYEGGDWLGSPWCALFASWCWSHAPGGSPFGVLASALKLRDWGASRGLLITAADLAVPGDVGIILRAQGRGHVELVAAPEIPGRPLSLVGGNVANSVRGTVRDRHQFSHVMRP